MLALLIGFSICGVVSILFAWKTLIDAHRIADTANQSREVSKKLELAMTASGSGLFEHQRGDSGPTFDERLSSMYGLKEQSGPIARETWEPLIHPDDLEHVAKAIRMAWEGIQSQSSVDFRAYHANGSLRYFRAQWIAERLSTGEISRVLGIQIDLTDIHGAMERERAANNQLEQIVEKIPGVLLEMGGPIRGQPDVIFVSPKCFDIWGVTPREFYANPMLFFEMHDPEDVQAFSNAIETSIDSGAPISHRYKIFARNGQTRWLDFRGSALVEDGRIIVKSVAIDVTDEVKTQQQLEREKEISRQAQKLESIGQLTSGVAHDFNNLLSIILGNLELLRSGEDAAHHDELIAAAITATMHGADLTKNMLAFARKAPLAPEILDINSLLENARTWMGRAVPSSIVVRTTLSSKLWPVAADRASLEGALLNLILNACDAMDGRGILRIDTSNQKIDNDEVDAAQNLVTPGKYVVVTVSDTGKGISQEHLSSIFEPFFTTKAPGAGSGIGLSMTMGFMEQTGGAIQVQSKPGEGASFKLYFPAFEEKVDASYPAATVKPSVECKGKRILLVEDEETVRKTLTKILEQEGHDVSAAASGDAAFSRFCLDSNFDLLLTDLILPGELLGTDLANRIREKCPELPVIFMTGYAGESELCPNDASSLDIRLMKPVSSSEIIEAIRRATAHSNPKDAIQGH